MSDANLSYATPTEAIRVFCGFPNRQFTEAQFFTQLGQTFMPGAACFSRSVWRPTCLGCSPTLRRVCPTSLR